MDVLAQPKLSLKRFLDKVGACADWRGEVPNLLPLMPSTEDCLRELAWLPDGEREQMRTQLALFQHDLGAYLRDLQAEVAAQKQAVQHAETASLAMRQYMASAMLHQH